MPNARKPSAKASGAKPRAAIAASYNAVKNFQGRRYTGMKVGRGHTWNYDAGQWKETKVTPDEWNFTFAVTKRRKGKAPEGSGVPVGTEYHWYILAHQVVKKLNANDYSTSLEGTKYKLAHRRADSAKYNISETTQRRHLIKLLEGEIAKLANETHMETPPSSSIERPTPRKTARVSSHRRGARRSTARARSSARATTRKTAARH
jgi:hypothetical protein